jgi:hypothetical protein
MDDEKKTRQRHQNNEGSGVVTYDCAFLEPLAFPPDLPPVILIDLDGLMKMD